MEWVRYLLFIVIELFEVEVVLNEFFNRQSLFFQIDHPVHESTLINT